MSWWGNTKAAPEPQPDSRERSGHWWWSVKPEANENDTALWGNRGTVYSRWEKPTQEPPEAPAPQAKSAPPVTIAQPKAAPELDIQPVKAERKAVIPNNVLFGFDKATLTPQGKAEIDKLTAEIKAHAKDTVIVEGHTCSVGEAAYNMGLGQRRADAVKGYMLETGIAAASMQSKSYGEEKPAVPNDTPANRKLNRRVEFKITMGDD